MLAKSNFDVGAALTLLGQHGLEAGLIVPTPTGLRKSIFDATAGTREYLAMKGYHDYSQQPQGEDHKVSRKVWFVSGDDLVQSNLSMYRPPTKSGDPRLWLGAKTRTYAGPHDLLALTVVRGELYVLNMSDPQVRASLGDPDSPFMRVLHLEQANDPVAELLGLLREVSLRGFVRTLRPGPTGVGMTLETLLGIPANSSLEPDFKGIELKSKRWRGSLRDPNRTTLFSRVPNWKLSPVGSAMNLLRLIGYKGDDGRLQLYQTLSAKQENLRGLKLEIDAQRDWLVQTHRNKTSGKPVVDAVWEFERLRSALASKHRETFWVRAKCRGQGEDEEFHYLEVRHTRGPLVGNLVSLLEAGVVTVDYLMHEQGSRVRDHGYLFKINPTNLDALFPPPLTYQLGR